MKPITQFLLILAVLLLSVTVNAQCVPDVTHTTTGLSPAPASLTCAVQGSAYSATIDFRNFNRIGASNIDSLHIDSIANLPCGIGYRINREYPTYTRSQNGCIDLCGTTSDPVGQYPMIIYVKVYARPAIPGITGVSVPLTTVGTRAGLDLRYWVRVKTAVGTCATIDTTTGSAANLTASCPTTSSTCGFIPPVFDLTQSLDSMCTGDTNRLHVTSVSGYTYNWFRNGTIIAGATDTIYSSVNTGTYYVRARSASSGGFYYSDTITIYLGAGCPPPPVFHVTSSVLDTICAGDSSILQVNLTSGYTYQWMRNAATLAGGTDTVYYATLAGVYWVRLVQVSTGAIFSSDSVRLYVKSCGPAPVFDLVALDDTICLGDSVLMHVNRASGYTYRWYLNGGAPIGGAIDTFYWAKTSGLYWVRATQTATGTNYYSDSVRVTVISCGPTPVFHIAYDKDTICFGDSAILTVHSAAGYTYRWYNNGRASRVTDTVFTARFPGLYWMRATATGGAPYIYSDTVEIVVLGPDTLNACMATWDNLAGNYKVVWSAAYNAVAASVNVYSDIGGAVTPVGSVPVSAAPVYNDGASSSATASINYYVTEIDECNVESGPSNTVNTIYLSHTVDASGARNLIWNAPVSFSPLKYRIWRGYSSAALTVLDSVTGTAYIDNSPFIGTFYYQIEAVMSSPCANAGSTIYNSALSNPSATGGTGISSPLLDAVNVFPNPLSDRFTIQLPAHSETLNIEVRDMKGSLLKSLKAEAGSNQLIVKSADWAEGVYLLYIRMDSAQRVMKLIKE